MPVIEIDINTATMQAGVNAAQNAVRQLDQQLRSMNASVGQTNSATSSTSRSMTELRNRVQSATQSLQGMSSQAQHTSGNMQSLSGSVSNFSTAIKGIGLTLVINQLIQMGQACVTAMMQVERLESAFRTITGSAGGAAIELGYIKDLCTKLGLNYVETAKSAKTFYAAISNTGIGQQADKIFTSVSKAVTALSLSGEEANRVFIALGQMLSKGKVQAEELRGQLGEALPGAFQLAAQAMGMTTGELDKFMSDGKLVAEDLLPKLADALENKFGSAAESASNNVSAAVNRMSSEWTSFKANVLSSGAVIDMINAITSALGKANAMLAGGSNSTAYKEAEKRLYAKNAPMLGSTQVRRDKGIYEEIKSYSKGQVEAEIEAFRQMQAYEANKKANQIRDDAFKASEIKKIEDLVGKSKSAKKSGKLEAIAEGKSNLEDLLNTGMITQEKYNEYLKGISTYESEVTTSGKKKKSSGKSSAEKLAENSARYQVSLSKLRNEVEALETALDGTTSAYDRQVKAIEAEKESAIKNADIVAEETIRRKQATAEQANETATLQKRKAELVAQQKLDQLNNKTLQEKASFYKELATATNDDSVAMETQVALLDKQKQLWADMGIPIRDVNQLYEIQKRKLTATPWEKCKMHMEDYFKSASDWSENFNQVWDTTMGNLSNALTEFVKSGKLDLQDLLDSFISMCIQMQMQAAASGIFKLLGSAIGSAFSSGITATVGDTTASYQSTGNLSYAERGGFSYGSSAIGNVFSGGNLSAYSNKIVSQPTFFGYGKHLSAYAQGAGLMGEAGPEAIMPLTRMSNGNLGVETSGTLPEINITVINQAGSDSTAKVTDQRLNSTGGMDIEVMICQAVASDIASRNGGAVAKAIQSTYGVKRYVRGV